MATEDAGLDRVSKCAIEHIGFNPSPRLRPAACGPFLLNASLKSTPFALEKHARRATPHRSKPLT